MGAAGWAALLRGIAEQARVRFSTSGAPACRTGWRARPTPEERSDDIRAVMDAAGSQRAALAQVMDGVPMSAVFAASHPELVSTLVLRQTASANLHYRLCAG